MKILMIIVAIVALVIVLGAFIISFRALRVIQKTPSTPENDPQRFQKVVHPQIDKELANLAKQRQKLEQKSKQTKSQ